MLHVIWRIFCSHKFKKIFVQAIISLGHGAVCGTGIIARHGFRLRLPPLSSCFHIRTLPICRLGHDPNFKFTVGRAIYKGILQFITSQHDKDYVVQPLPVSNFAIRFGKKKKNTLELSWKGEDDPQEPSARPREYIVYTRIGYGGFDNGTLVSKASYTVKIEPGLVYSFKVTAANRGGESFPSEILSAYKAKREREKVLIINGFDRISGPAVINTPDKAGFDLEQDPGVPYLSNFSFCGVQSGFDRTQAGKEGKESLGHSSSELEGMKIAGNTFDYPFIHGKAIQATGKYSFVSCSDEAVENGIVTLEDYPIVDYILGLEKEDASAKAYYKTFSFGNATHYLQLLPIRRKYTCEWCIRRQ